MQPNRPSQTCPKLSPLPPIFGPTTLPLHASRCSRTLHQTSQHSLQVLPQVVWKTSHSEFLPTILRRIRLLTCLSSPLTTNGEPVTPSCLSAYSRTHDFDFPHCFHGVTARTFTVRGTGPLAGKVMAACGSSRALGQTCNFWSTSFFPLRCI